MNYDKSKYKTWTWKHPLMLHWMLNPGLAINELLLGQRVPKLMFIERDSPKALANKSFIPCPHCGTLHPGSKWSVENNSAFYNWFGLYCDKCGQIIPCLRNLTSWLLLALSFPIWYGFKDKWKEKWRAKQASRLLQPQSNEETKTTKWWYTGLAWGLFIFLAINLLLPILNGESISMKKALVGIPIWVIGGLMFGWFTHLFTAKKKESRRQH